MKLLFLALVLCSGLFAEEPAPGAEVLYRSVTIDGASYRVIVTTPKTQGHFPAVLLIGGLGCYSLADLKPGDAYYELLYGLTRKNYVTMRVEKNGQGASQGPPCASPQSDLQLAVRRSVAGLNALASYDFVDRDKIFILAHSIGPSETPARPIRQGISSGDHRVDAKCPLAKPAKAVTPISPFRKSQLHQR